MSRARLNASGARREVGEVFPMGGNVKPVSVLFPNICLTNFAVHQNVLASIYPDYVPWLRAIRFTLSEGISPVDEWTFTASGTVVTPAGTQVADMMNDLQADFLAWTEIGGTSAYRPVNLGGVDYLITDVDADANEITVATTPPASGTLIIYLNRITGTTSQARIFSHRGKDLRGAGASRFNSGLMWRDQMQKIEGVIGQIIGTSSSVMSGAFSATTRPDGGTLGSGYVRSDANFNSANSPDARASATTDEPNATHGSGTGVHLYQHVGRVLA
jgi:hypothetical protein